MAKPVLCLDMDGVCHRYSSGWQGIDVLPDPPVPGLNAFLREAVQHFAVYIHSSRSSEEIGRVAMRNWFLQHCGAPLTSFLCFPEHKPPAMVTLDDRALTFLGTWPDVQALLAFTPWTRNTAPPNERPPAPWVSQTEILQQAMAILAKEMRLLAHEPDVQSELEKVWALLHAVCEDEARRATL